MKPPPKCATPEEFKNQPIKKIRIGTDIHCSPPVNNQPQLELVPEKTQLLFEGDSLTLTCRAPRVALGSMREQEDFAIKSNAVFWGWSEKIVKPGSKEDIVFLNPKEKFPTVSIEERHYSDSGILYSVLRIPYVTRNHSGLFDCTLRQKDDTHLSRRVSVLVISDKTKYCLAQETHDNKGIFSWPRTIRGNIVKLPCYIEGVGSSFAARKCNDTGNWEPVDTANCPYIRETTRVLEQFAKVNLTIARGSVLESARRLRSFTAKEHNSERFKDVADVIYTGKTVQNYLEFISLEKELSSIIIDIVSNVMELPRKLLEHAQFIDGTCKKLIDAAEEAASHTTSADSQKDNLAIELFKIPIDVFVGITCSWIKIDQTRRFHCNIANKPQSLAIHEKNIEASIQFPTTQYSGSQTHRLLVSVYNNNKFFPQNKTHGNYQITSSIIGAKLVPPPSIMPPLTAKNLTDPIFIVLKAAPFHDDISLPKPVWFDPDMNDGAGGWSLNQGCQSLHYSHGILMFSCNRLGFYGLVQHTKALNDFLDENAGAKFRFSPIGFYLGSLILFFAMWLNIATYVVFFNQIMMGRRIKHSLINTWLTIAMLVFTFAIGIYQTEDSKICQFFGVAIHYLSLCVLVIHFNNLSKRFNLN